MGLVNVMLAVMGRGFAHPILGIFGILVVFVFWIVGLFALYLVIRAAAKSALKEYYDEKELRERRAQSSA